MKDTTMPSFHHAPPAASLDRVADRLAAHPAGVTCADLAAEVRLSPSYTFHLLKALAEAGRVEQQPRPGGRVGAVLWVPTPEKGSSP